MNQAMASTKSQNKSKISTPKRPVRVSEDPSSNGGHHIESKRAKPKAMTKRNASKKNDSGVISNPQSRSTPKKAKQQQPR